MYDFYEILEVSRNTSPEVIKAAYRRLSQKYHPDHDSSEAARQAYLDVQTAYEILIDPATKLPYDDNLTNYERSQGKNKLKLPRFKGFSSLGQFLVALVKFSFKVLFKLLLLIIASPVLIIRFIQFTIGGCIISFVGYGIYTWFAYDWDKVASSADVPSPPWDIIGYCGLGIAAFLTLATALNILFGDGELL